MPFSFIMIIILVSIGKLFLNTNQGLMKAITLYSLFSYFFSLFLILSTSIVVFNPSGILFFIP